MAGRLEQLKKLLLGSEEERNAIIADFNTQRKADPTSSDEDFWDKWAESKSSEVTPPANLAGFRKATGVNPPDGGDSFLGSMFKGVVGGIEKATDPFSTFMAKLIYKDRPAKPKNIKDPIADYLRNR